MTLEQSAVEFFSALHATCKDKLGHEEFAFTVNISVSVKAEDTAVAQLINAEIQAALNAANATIKPIKVSLQ